MDCCCPCGGILFFKVRKWFRSVGSEVGQRSAPKKSGWEALREVEAKVKKKAASVKPRRQEEDSVFFVHNENSGNKAVKQVRKPVQPKAGPVKERNGIPRRFGREEREARMNKGQFSVGRHLAKRKYLKAYK